MKQAILALALMAGLAHADDGIAIFVPRAPVGAAEVARPQIGPSAWSRGYESVLTVSVHMRAIESDVIAATIEGKVYRFVGKRTVVGNRETWTGLTANGDYAFFEVETYSNPGARNGKNVTFLGSFDVDGGKVFALRAREGELVKTGSWSDEVQAAARRAWAERETSSRLIPTSTGASVGYCDGRKVVSNLPTLDCEEWRAKFK